MCLCAHVRVRECAVVHAQRKCARADLCVCLRVPYLLPALEIRLVRSHVILIDVGLDVVYGRHDHFQGEYHVLVCRVPRIY
jgi:hypothetical protein